MNNQSNLINFIIVLGTTKSGSGAVFDYLNGRGDLYNPLKGQEYHLPQMPNGLMTLEAISKNAFHPGTSDYVLSRFEENSKNFIVHNHIYVMVWIILPKYHLFKNS